MSAARPLTADELLIVSRSPCPEQGCPGAQLKVFCGSPTTPSMHASRIRLALGQDRV